MNDQPENLQSKFRNQSWTNPDRNGNWQKPDVGDNKADFFGLERGNRFVRRFKLFLRTGSIISIPYAYLPVIIYDPDTNLKIKTGDIEITIKGRGLEKLSDWLNEEKVLWIKESASNTDTQDTDVFVSEITVEGDMLA